MNKSKKYTLSIIIPVLNEAENLPILFEHLFQNLSEPRNTEILLIDGGSTDNSKHAFEQFKSEQPQLDLNWVESPLKGRAPQMNLGARTARGSIFYFLHADSFPPVGFDADIKQQIAKGNAAGCFRMRFNSTHWWLRLAGWFTRFNWMICRGGDQSQFISRELFEEIGGLADALGGSSDDRLKKLGKALEDGMSTLKETTDWIVDRLRDEPSRALAAASAYMDQFGLVAGAFYLAKGAAAAAERAKDDNDTSAFYAARLEVADYFAHTKLPQVASLKTVITGAGPQLVEQCQDRLAL